MWFFNIPHTFSSLSPENVVKLPLISQAVLGAVSPPEEEMYADLQFAWWL